MILLPFVHQFLSVCGGGEKYEKRLCEGRQPALCDLRFVFNHFDRFARESAGHMCGGGCIRLHPAAFPVEKLALYAAGAGAALFAVLFAGRITNAVLNLFSAPQAMPGQQPLPSNLARANL